LNEPTDRIDQSTLRKLLAAILSEPKGVYSPAEDSFLMLQALSSINVEGRKVLDVGSGSGILGLYCVMRGAQVTITDIDEIALRHAKGAAERLGVSVNAVLSDLFSNIGGRYDIVLFNPPYLPSSTIEDKSVDGGKKGAALTARFLNALETHLDKDGIALLLVSSQNDPAALISHQHVFQASVLARRPLFFEELQVLGLRFRENAAC
jgi:release factor glutamine methyltransferase